MMRVCAPRLTGECIKGARAESARERRFWRPGQVATAWPDAPHGRSGVALATPVVPGNGRAAIARRAHIYIIRAVLYSATCYRVFSFGRRASWFVSAGARAKRMADGPRQTSHQGGPVHSAQCSRNEATAAGYDIALHAAATTDGFSLMEWLLTDGFSRGDRPSIVITARAPSSTPPCAPRPQPALRCRGACP